LTVGTGSRRVVLLGAGPAHLHVLKCAAAFARRGHELVAVAPDRFWYSGLATGMLGGGYPPELDQVDVAALAARGDGRHVQDRVVGIDPAARVVHLEGRPPIAYDALSLNLGSEAPEIPGSHGRGEVYAVKPIRRLWELRADLEARFRSDPARTVRVVVAGGGVTGCELAANLAALTEASGGRIEITVLARGGEVLRQLPRRASERVVHGLERRGVAFRTKARVERIADGRAVLRGGDAIPFDALVNATGLRPSPAVRSAGLPVDREGALLVNEHLRSIADPAVHGGGDCVAHRGRELPKVGVYAIRQAPVLFRNLLASLDGAAPERFRPQRRYLWIMNLGDGTGLAARGPFWWHGRGAFWLKDRIDRRFLREYQAATEPEAA
jgi:NADH dehydrogenase FAD-containing subunit